MDYRDGNVWLMYGDCLEGMKEIPDGSVDLVLTDPPYKVTSRGGRTSAGGMLLDTLVRKGEVFAENNTPLSCTLLEVRRVLKDGGHIYLMSNNKNILGHMNTIKECGFTIIKNLIWVKNNKIMSQAYMSQFEYIIFARKGSFKKINNCGTSDVLMFENPREKIHPTEKPVNLLEVIIGNSSDLGEVVLDPFMGSGSAGVACRNLNRKFIGIELDDKYFNIAKDRILGV